jgi:hypothetical protein
MNVFILGGLTNPVPTNNQPHFSHHNASQFNTTAPAPKTARFSSAFVTSPYNSKLLRGNSPFNSPNSLYYRKYLCGREGISSPEEFDEMFLCELGFSLDVHDEIRQGTFFILDWFGNPAVNLKYIGNFHKLEEITPEAFLDWYAYISADMQT